MKIGGVNTALALKQHLDFVSALSTAGARVIEVPFLHGEFDSVFAKDNAILLDRDGDLVAMLARPLNDERASEQSSRKNALISQGFEIERVAEEHLEGGDVVILPKERKVFFGYGQRSSINAFYDLEKFTGFEVIPLELVDPYFFHLDTALNFVEVGGRQVAVACKAAFSESSWRKLISDHAVGAVVEVSRDEALQFGLNWIEVNGTVILGSHLPELARKLSKLNRRVVIAPLDQFQLAGGSAACLATRIHQIVSRTHATASEIFLRQPERVLFPN